MQNIMNGLFQEGEVDKKQFTELMKKLKNQVYENRGMQATPTDLGGRN
jgi:hypothetical protein